MAGTNSTLGDYAGSNVNGGWEFYNPFITSTPEHSTGGTFTINPLYSLASDGVGIPITDENGVPVLITANIFISIEERIKRLEDLHASLLAAHTAIHEESHKQQSEKPGLIAAIQIELDGLDRYFEEREV